VADEIQVELNRSREKSARLLAALARKIKVPRAVRATPGAPDTDVVYGVRRAIWQRPLAAVAVAVALGYLIGRALSRRALH
jgi:hypothetical protein